MALEKDTFKNCQCIFTTIIFALISPCICRKLNPLSVKRGCFGQEALEKETLKSCQCIFGGCMFAIIWRKAWSFLWTNLNSFYPRMFWAKLQLVEIIPVALEKILNSHQFSPFSNYIPFNGVWHDHSVKEKLKLLHPMNTSINTLFAWN